MNTIEEIREPRGVKQPLENSSEITITVPGSLQPKDFIIELENDAYSLSLVNRSTSGNTEDYVFGMPEDIKTKRYPINDYKVILCFEFEDTEDNKLRFKNTSNSKFTIKHPHTKR